MPKGRAQNLIGRVFGRLRVQQQADRDTRSGRWWVCICACDGKLLEVRGDNLTAGKTTSCGCLRRERAGRPRKYALQDDREIPPELRAEHLAWTTMIARCEWPSSAGFVSTGGRGICVHERWRQSFRTFLEDVGRKPSPDHVLAREDLAGHFEPGNVRWATRAAVAAARARDRDAPGRKRVSERIPAADPRRQAMVDF